MTRLVRSELIKLFSTRLWWGLLVGVVLSSAAFAALLSLTAGQDLGPGAPTGGIDDPSTARTVYTAGISVAYLFALALGVIVMAGEFRHQTMTATALAVPHRARIVVAKLAAVTVVGAGYGVATVLTGVLVGAPILAARGGEALPSDVGALVRALLLAVLAIGLWAVIGLGVGTLIRNQVLALMLAIGLAWFAEPLIGLGLNAADLGEVARFLPSMATSALVEPSTGGGGFTFDLLPWWGAALVLLGYALVSGGLGTLLTLRRDIT